MKEFSIDRSWLLPDPASPTGSDGTDAGDLEARYNHLDKTLKLSVTVFP